MVLPSVDLPWPHRDLHPNARVHYMTRAKKAKRARRDGAIAAQAAGLRTVAAKALNVTAIFMPPDRRAHDVDGLLSSIKSALDGIADVIGVDDSRWRITLRKDEPRPLGAVRIEIEVPA